MAELAYILRLAQDLRLLPTDEWESLDAARQHAGRLTWGLHRSMSGSSRLKLTERGGTSDPADLRP